MAVFDLGDGRMTVTHEHGSSGPTAARKAHRKSPSRLFHPAAGLLLAAALSISAGCKDAPKPAARPPEPVKVAPVIQRDVPIYAEWVGTTVGYVTAQIRARVSGYLISQNYREGTLVKSGDLMFQIDPRPYQIALNQARAQLRTTESQLEQARAQVAQAEADLLRAEANQKKTELDVARYTPLAARGSVSQQELDDAVQNNLANLASVAAQKANVANARATVSKTQAEISRAQASLADAELNLSWTKVTSPISGIAGIKNADIGDLIATSTTLTSVSLVNPIYVQVAVAEQEYMRWRQRGWNPDTVGDRKGQLEMTLADGSTFPHPGTPEIVDRQVGVTTGTISIRGVFPNPGDLLRPGQFAKVRTVVDTKMGALLVPQRAVRDLQGQHQVAVVGAGDTVDIRTVKLAERVGSLWIVSEGLKPGERVIVEGIDKVKTGEKVKPLPAEAEPGGQAAKPAAAPAPATPAATSAPPAASAPAGTSAPASRGSSK
jgi:membrane fusion protein, multidrug efflux system